MLVENVPAGESALVALPQSEFTMSGKYGDREYTETFTPHSNTRFIIAVRGSSSGDPQLIYYRTSPLTIAEYLRSVGEGAQFSAAADVIGATELLEGLPDDGEYTLFLPTNDATQGVSLPSEPDELAAALSDHIVEGSIPPYLLPANDTLTTRSGRTVSLDFGSTASGYWEIDGVPILWELHLANGVIYAIDGIIDLSR